MNKITVGNSVYFAAEGERLSDVLIRNGLSVEHPCGGRGVCGKCRVTVNGREELSCRYEVRSDITVTLPKKDEMVSETGATESGNRTENLCFALDIGTTTLALALVSLDEKSIVRVITGTNPQRRFGADVISRIDHCMKNGTDELTACLIEEINSMIAELCVGHELDMYVAANSTMLHTLFGVDCSSIGVAPYSAVFLGEKCEDGRKTGLRGIARVYSLPSVHSFVGADIVAGMNLVGLPSEKKYNLLVDLGTNAEIALFSRERALCTSAAAGPCFEGANITCGMSATPGAICAFSRDRKVSTIGDEAPKGICGTGLIDIVAALVSDGTVDETGAVEEDEINIADGVYLTGQDVRQLQLAKSAVYSAILALMKREKIGFDAVETLYISGGFSAKLNLDSAVYIGLLPSELKEKCRTLNNSSLLGTVKFACEKNDLTPYLENAEYIDLSADKSFTDLFVENMFFE